MRGRGNFGYPIIFAFGTDVRALDFIHAGQARFLRECGAWVRIAGKICCDFGGGYASSALTRRCRGMSRPSGRASSALTRRGFEMGRRIKDAPPR